MSTLPNSITTSPTIRESPIPNYQLPKSAATDPPHLTTQPLNHVTPPPNPLDAFPHTQDIFDRLAKSDDIDAILLDFRTEGHPVTARHLEEFLSSKRCQDRLNLQEQLLEIQIRLKANYHAHTALSALHEVTESKNPIARRLAAAQILELAGITPPEKAPTRILHQSITSRMESPPPSAG